MKDLKIWFAASEVAPFAKTGGLADVAGSLPKALKKLGVDIRVVMPKYGQIEKKYTDQMTFLGNTYVDLTWRKQYCGVYHLEYDGITFYFIDNEFYFYRDWFYGMYDDGERFTFFCKAILEVLPLIGFKPDIIHLNDWQTGLVSPLLDDHYRKFREDGFYEKIHTLFTIHNLKYQGVFPKAIMNDLVGLDWRFFHTDGIEYYDNINFLKAALAFSTAISTVSKTYAEEIKYDFFGENLQGLIQKRSNDMYGIINGIDYESNDPQNDPRLYAPFSKDDTSGKLENKKKLQADTGLKVSGKTPLIAVISRLIDQKGFDLIERMLHEIMALDVQMIILGAGDGHYEELFKQAQEQYPGRFSTNIKYDAKLAQRIYAGSDLFLMPSLYEPCGLSQIFSMRYGTVPIVRETGGLKDTVTPYNDYTGEGTGFSFANYNAHEMKDAILRALEVYKNKKAWSSLVRTCMSQDFSWDSSAREYKELYENMIKRFK